MEPKVFVQYSPEHAPTLMVDGKPVGIVKRLASRSDALDFAKLSGLTAEDAELHRDPDFGSVGE
jgi:hypothetical protein